MPIKPEKYLNKILGVERTKKILSVNPTILPFREEAKEVKIFIHDYNTEDLEQYELKKIDECFLYKNNGRTTWINIDGLRKKDVEAIAANFDIHYLITEDILSINQRPKMDEINTMIYCLLNMLYYNAETTTVEQEQISLILGADYVLSFQEDARRDVFDPLRERLKIVNSKLRQNGPDYLFYCLLDLIVDNYYLVMEELGSRIEQLEEEVIKVSNKHSLARINKLRKELIVLRRNITPVRDLINGILKSDSDLLQERNTKYFKDVYDHIIQAHDLTENYRDVLMNIQDLYFGNVNLKMNEVMKVMAVVTCLLAPPTVIVGIFGMNFERIPFTHSRAGFYLTVSVTLLIPMVMLYIFKRRGWF